MRSLKENIVQTLSKQEGTFAVAFKDLSTGKELLINDTITFHAASTMKTPVLIEVYRQAAEGKFSLTDSIELKNEFKSIADGSFYKLDSTDDSEKELYKHIGEQRTIDSLVYQMIIVSSNFATNLLIEKLGVENIRNTVTQLGAEGMQVLRGVEDQKAFDKGLNNSTTARGLMVLFERIGSGTAVGRKPDAAMVDILKRQKFNDGIPAGLPKNVAVAHKTGNITRIHHDAGIVFAKRPYVLVILVRGRQDSKQSGALMAKMSRAVYNSVR